MVFCIHSFAFTALDSRNIKYSHNSRSSNSNRKQKPSAEHIFKWWYPSMCMNMNIHLNKLQCPTWSRFHFIQFWNLNETSLWFLNLLRFLVGIVDSTNSTNWLFETIKNEKEKFNESTGEIRRNRTRIFVYPFSGRGYFENLPIKTTVRTITHIETAINPGNYVILPGRSIINTKKTLTLNHLNSNNLKLFIQFEFDSFFAGPGDINESKNGLYQWSVTLTARMWPPIEVGSPKLFGLPIVIWWGILTGCLIVLLIALLFLFLFCWFLPHRGQKTITSTQRPSVSHDLNGVTASNLDLTGKLGIFTKFFCGN